MRKLLSSLALALAVAAPTVAIATPAEAAPKQKTPDCITQKEFRQIQIGTQGPPKVRQIVGNPGRTDFYSDLSYYDGAWVNDGYYESYVNYDPYYDYYYTDYYYVDTSYYDAYAGAFHPRIDEARSYKKCKSWKTTSRRATVWFDSYSYGPEGSMLVYNKWNYDVFGYGGRTAPKDLDEVKPERPAKPDFGPAVPKPEVTKEPVAAPTS